MKIIKKTFQAVVLNLLIISSFFVFVNCFQKQELWPVVLSGGLLLIFVVMKISTMKGSSRSAQRYYH